MKNMSNRDTFPNSMMVFVFLLFTAVSIYAQINPYCMWGENDILCQSDKMREKIQQTCRNGNPNSLNFDPTDDCCIYNPSCEMAGKLIKQSNWLYQQCTQGNQTAGEKLLRMSRAPSPPPSAYPRPPYPPGYER